MSDLYPTYYLHWSSSCELICSMKSQLQVQIEFLCTNVCRWPVATSPHLRVTDTSIKYDNIYIAVCYFYGCNVLTDCCRNFLLTCLWVFQMQEVQEFMTPVRGTLQTSCLTSAHSRLTPSQRAHRSATSPAVIFLDSAFLLCIRSTSDMSSGFLCVSAWSMKTCDLLVLIYIHIKWFIEIFFSSLWCFRLLKWATVSCFYLFLIFLECAHVWLEQHRSKSTA